jgi:hypothetical protein
LFSAVEDLDKDFMGLEQDKRNTIFRILMALIYKSILERSVQEKMIFSLLK